VDTSGKVVKQGALVNAQLVFSQVFSDKGAPLAIKIFFFIFGIAIELTLALSSLPNFKKILKPVEEEEEPESTEVFEPKQKRSYKRRQTVPKVPTLGTGVSESQTLNEEDITFTGSPDDVPIRPIQEAVTDPIVLSEKDAKVFLEALQSPPESNEALKDLMRTELPKIEDVPVRPVVRPEERYIKALYNNEGHPYLKDKTVAAKEASISIPEALKMFDFLSSVNGPTGTKYIEFRPSTSKWYPNYTSELILSLLNDDKITLL
jgi:hypothetical protein